MVTLAFFIVLILLSIIVAFFDTITLGYSFWGAYVNLFYTEVAIGRYFVLTGLMIGLIGSLIIDLRIHLNKRKIEENYS